MEEAKSYKVVGTDQRSGVARNGQTWTISNVTVDYDGKPCRVRIVNDLAVQTGDSVSLSIGTRRAFGSLELVVNVKEVIPVEKGE